MSDRALTKRVPEGIATATAKSTGAVGWGRPRLRGTISTILLSVALGTAAPAGSIPTASAAEKAKPTIVLVHGAFADSSSWNGVVTRLAADGYNAIAAANPLRGVKTDAQYVASIVAS